jgi:hypothetical protein
MVHRRNPPSQTWRTFLENHVKTTVSIDFFTVPTIRFQVLYVFLVLAHDSRRIVHFNVTAHPTAEWTGQQLREAFPFEQVPRYLLRDRDSIFGADFTKEVRDLGIDEVALGAAFPLATGLHRTRDWVDSARVHRPRDRFQRDRSISTPEIVYGVLSRDSDAPFAGEGHADESVGATAGPWAGGRAAASWRSSSSVRTSGSVIAGCAGSCRVRLQPKHHSLAGRLPVRPSIRHPRQNQRADQCQRHCDRGESRSPPNIREGQLPA